MAATSARGSAGCVLLMSSRSGGERYLGVIYMVCNTKLSKFLYNFEGKFLFYIPIRGMFDHLSIVMQPVLEPGTESYRLWRKIIPDQMDKFAVCVELLTRPQFTAEDGRVHDPSWAPHIKLVNWDPRDSVINTSTYAWNFAMILIGTHEFSKNFGSYSALWKDCQTFVKYIVPHFQGQRAKGGLEGKRIDNREDLDDLLRSHDCILNTTDTAWTRQQEEGGLASTTYFCYVALAPASRPDLFLTASEDPAISPVSLQPASEEARPDQQFYLEYSIDTGHCTLSRTPRVKIGASVYEAGQRAVCGAEVPSTKFLSRNVLTIDGGTSRLKLHLVASSKRGSAAAHSVDSSLVLSYSETTNSVEFQKAAADNQAQTWIMTERLSTQIPSCPAATLFDGGEYQLSPASDPDRVLTFHSRYPLLTFKMDDIADHQTLVFEHKSDTSSWLLLSKGSNPHAFDVAKKSTKKGAPLHFWKNKHGDPHQQFQIFRYGEPSDTGVQQVFIIVQHTKLFLKVKETGVVQDQCHNPPPPCFLWNLTPKNLPTSPS